MDLIKQKRSILRTQTTKLITKIENSLGNAGEEELEELLAELTLKEQELNSLDLEILPKLKVEDIEQEIIRADEYKTNLTIWKTRINRARGKLYKASNSTISATNTEKEVTIKKSDCTYINLPRLIIDKYNGEPAEFQRFWDQFEAAIHKNSEMSNIDKFNYLKSYVTGLAADSIKGISLTNDNYQAAIDTLKARFGKKTILINAHLNKLLNLTPVRRSTDVQSLRKLLDVCEAEMRNLETLGLKSENYSAMLCPILVKLLPSDIVLEITKKYNADDEWKVSDILDILKIEVISREKANALMANSRQVDCSFSPPVLKRRDGHELPYKAGKNRTLTPTAYGLLNESYEKRTKCYFCKSDKHLLSGCQEFRLKNLNEKKEFLTQNGCCFVCFCKGHLAQRCKSSVKCKVCLRRHYEIMCPEKDKVEKSRETLTESTTLANKTNNCEVLMQTLTLTLIHEDKKLRIRALFDTGSQKSYLTKETARKVGYAPIGKDKLNHSLFGGLQNTQEHKRYRIYLSNIEQTYSCNFEVYDQEKICVEIPKIRDGPWINEARNLGITFSDYANNEAKENKNCEIQLLVGADIYGKLLTGNVKLFSNGLTAIETYLGWTLMGKIPFQGFSDNEMNTMAVTNLLVQDLPITKLWDLDVIGITDPVAKKAKEEKDLEIKMQFQNSVSLNKEGRYEVALPWAEDRLPLPTNKELALKRLESTTQKLRSQNLFTRYDEVFKMWRDLGIIEEVRQDENIEQGHYLPHRPVVKENSSTPVRPVFDASARVKFSPSLNQSLERGPNLIEQIASLLQRFRERKFGVVADIEKAFLQISIRPSDRHYLKFFWWENEHTNEVKVFQHTRVVFGVSCSPFLLGAVIDYHLLSCMKTAKYDHQVAEKLRQSFYVDNVLASLDSEIQLLHFIEESAKMMASAKFNLRYWQYSKDSNPEVMTNLLGLIWNREYDTLKLNLNWIDDKHIDKISKRVILALTHKVFDPVGFFCPVLLIPKLMIQSLWNSGLSWDAEVDEITREKFLSWYKDLVLLKEISIPRWIHCVAEDKTSRSIHTFCDASGNAYAAAVFLRIQTASGFEVHLLAAKSRVAPKKSITIPRLELIAATVGARLCASVMNGLRWQNEELIFWTDSSTVLTWIQKEELWSVFVSNRVREIRKLTNPRAWRYIKGVENPADLPSRGCSIRQFLAKKWWEGPAWLRKNENEWPMSNLVFNQEEIAEEKKKGSVVNTQVNIQTEEIFQRISRYPRLIRITAWIYRFFRNISETRSNRKLEKDLSVEEINAAEMIIFKYIQQQSLTTDTRSCYTSLETFTDDHGIIRVKTRIASRKDLETFRYPIVLPDEHHITECLILQKHQELNHAGTQIVMSNLREQFWILRCRRTVRKVINKCVRCKRFSSRPVEVSSAPLPEERVREALVFEAVGVDLTGPLFLRNGNKSWVVLFTCAVFRAIHIELITSLSTESFLLAFRRFIARRGRPATVFSDNGTNFRRTATELKSVDFQKIKEFAAAKKIQWKFNPPSAPWWGGFFERMIGMLKAILRRILGKAKVDYEELCTILCDAESVINSRPLTYVSEDPEDLKPLTPAMFLQEIVETGVADIDQIDKDRMRRRYAYLQKLKADLRKRFRIEYLGQLKGFAKAQHKETPIKEGDVVIIGDDNTKRINWPLGRVVAVHPGKDKKTRVVRVKTQSGSYLRPVKRLYPLEVQ